MPKNYFDERIAKGYEAKWPEIFEPAVVDSAVSFLADLAGSGPALELGIGIADPRNEKEIAGPALGDLGNEWLTRFA